MIADQITANGSIYTAECLRKMCENKPIYHFDEGSKSVSINLDEVEFAPEMIGNQLVGVSIVAKSAVRE